MPSLSVKGQTCLRLRLMGSKKLDLDLPLFPNRELDFGYIGTSVLKEDDLYDLE